MTAESVQALQTVLSTIEASAARATTRAEVVNLRVLWGQVRAVLDTETSNG